MWPATNAAVDTTHVLNVAFQAIQAAQFEIVILAVSFVAHALITGKRGARATDNSTNLERQLGFFPAAGSSEVPALLQAAVRAGDLSAALGALPTLACTGGSALTGAQQGLLGQVVQLAIKHSELPALLGAVERCRGAKPACVYNTVLDGCAECQDLEAAEHTLALATTAGVADLVTWNTVIKARLRAGKLRSARAAVKEMQGWGLQPNTMTFNELIDATISNDSGTAWHLLDEMKACGLKPNHVTCSILLKSVHPGAPAANADRVLAVVDGMEGGVDEVLLSSVLEACIRVGRHDLLERQLRRHREENPVPVRNAQTYGSIIRAYGAVRDVRGVRGAWREMLARGVMPTSVTLGCTVEALASNRDPDGAHRLLLEALADEATRSIVNAVPFSSVLKGFSHERRFDRVWAIYQEMIERGFESQFTNVTYNTLVDAFGRCGEIRRVPAILDSMARSGVEPTIVTYCAVIKGYCHDNQLDRACEVMETMKQSRHMRPDEQTYNTLLDGCTRQGLYERGMKVFDDMLANGVHPSNFTLSILVKLAGRGRRLDKAFELCRELPSKYGFQPNVHVYNNLIQACTLHKDVPRAMEVLEEMLEHGVRPDARTYTVLLRGCLAIGDARRADAAIRAAIGLPGAPAQLASARPREALPKELICEALDGIARPCGTPDLAVQLFEDLRTAAGMTFDRRWVSQFTSRVMRKTPRGRVS